jgi:predicted porin
MNKKLLTAAVAAALTAPAAMAGDVTIYGQMHIATSSYDGDVDTADAWDISSHASRLGFKGTEGLGNGLTAVWQLELQVQPTDNNNNTTNGGDGITYRNSFLGLTGGWGTAVIGRHDTPLKISTGSLDLFGDTIADYNANGASDEPTGAGNVGLALLGLQGLGFVDLRVDQAIAYISPSMNGLTIAAAIVQPGMDTGLSTTATAHDADSFSEAYSIAALYSNGPFFASLAYENLSEDLIEELLSVTSGTAAAFDEEERWRLGLGYTANGFHVGFVYEDQDHAIDGVDADRWQLSGSYTFGNNVVKAMYGENEVDLAGADIDMDQWAIGLDHNFSKNTKVYAVYTDFDSDGNGLDWDGFSVGMVHKF